MATLKSAAKTANPKKDAKVVKAKAPETKSAAKPAAAKAATKVEKTKAAAPVTTAKSKPAKLAPAPAKADKAKAPASKAATPAKAEGKKIAASVQPAPAKASAKPVAPAKAPARAAEPKAVKTPAKPVAPMKSAEAKPVAKTASAPAAAAAKSPAKTSAKATATKTKKPVAGQVLSETDLLAMSEDDYMNEAQLAFFRAKLEGMREEILENARETGEHLKENEVFADPNDRATVEEENMLEQRVRDRERKLLKKIESTIKRIESGDYGYCKETGDPIGIPRLLARPTADLSIEAQEKHERLEKLYAD